MISFYGPNAFYIDLQVLIYYFQFVFSKWNKIKILNAVFASKMTIEYIIPKYASNSLKRVNPPMNIFNPSYLSIFPK